jgi:short-subunit dehydrogenase
VRKTGDTGAGEDGTGMGTTTQGRPFAVVTGASSGIGYELAKQFAQHGYDLLIAAEDTGIERAADDLRRDGGPWVQAVQVDLATFDGVEELYAAITSSGRPVDAIAINAGRGAGGDFTRGTDLRDELNIIDLNVTSTVHLAKRVLPEMVRRGAGRVLFTSSIASTMPGAFQAVYNASKSFVQSFSEAIRNELKETGVTVTSLMPGPTETKFFERADMLDTKFGTGPKDDPAVVAKQGFEALMKGDDHVVAGSLMNKVQAVAGKVVPDTVKAQMHRKMAEPGSADG